LLVATLALALVPDRPRPLAWVRTALGAVLVLWAAVLGWKALVLGPTGIDRTIVGLVSATPLVVLGVLRGPYVGRGQPVERRIAPACVVAAVAIAFVVYRADVEKFAGGLQFGSRYLLPLVPLLLIGAAD